MLKQLARDPRLPGLLAAALATSVLIASPVLARPKAKAQAKHRIAPLPTPRPVALEGSAALPASGSSAAAVTPASLSVALPPQRIAPPSGEAAALGAALAQVERGRIDEATATARRLSDPVARSLIEWAIIRSGAIDRDYQRIAAFAREHAHWPAMSLVRRRGEAALYKVSAPPTLVLAHFGGQPPLSAEGRLAIAEAYLTLGKADRAAEFARRVWQNDTLSESREQQVLSTFGSYIGPADHRARYASLLFREDAEGGLRAAQRLGSGDLALARAWAAVIRGEKKAAQLLDSVPSDWKRHSGFLLSLLKHLRAQDRIADAVVVLAKSPKEARALGAPDAWWEERRIISRRLLDDGDAATAYRVAADHAAESPAERAEAEFHAGWIALQFLRRPELAEGHFATLAREVTTPISLSRAWYWLGRTAEARGDQSEARRRYSAAARHHATFYGQLALQKIGTDRLALPPAPQPSKSERTAFEADDLVRATRLLAEAGQKTLALQFATALCDRFETPGQLALVAELTREIGDEHHLVIVGKKATQKGYPLESYAFPTGALPRYTPVGPTIDTAVVYAIARQESQFHAGALSPAGARGLMQLMPGTAQMTAKAYKVPYNVRKLTSDPAYNVKIGAAHLADLVENYRGSYILAFAAYNAGPGRVVQWVRKYGDPRSPGVDPIDWIERIPFSETRNYVQRVMENVQVYRARFDGAARLEIEADLRRGGTAAPTVSAASKASGG